MLGLAPGHSVVVEALPVAAPLVEALHGVRRHAGCARRLAGDRRWLPARGARRHRGGRPGTRAPAAQRADADRRRDGGRSTRRRTGRASTASRPSATRLGPRSQAGRRHPPSAPSRWCDALGRASGSRARCMRRRPGWTSRDTPISSTPPRSAIGTTPRSAGTTSVTPRPARRAPGGGARDPHRRAGDRLVLGIGGRRGSSPAGHEHARRRGLHGPVEDSAEGVVSLPLPTYRAAGGSTACGSASTRAWSSRRPRTRARTCCDAALALDDGARRLGEIGIGTNFSLTRGTGRILLDEKIGGTFHLAIGAGYPETGGTNRSAEHWDLVGDLRTAARSCWTASRSSATAASSRGLLHAGAVTASRRRRELACWAATGLPSAGERWSWASSTTRPTRSTTAAGTSARRPPRARARLLAAGADVLDVGGQTGQVGDEIAAPGSRSRASCR